MNWAFNQDISKSSAKLVLIAISNYADEKGIAYPSWTTLEKKCSSSRKTIYNSLKYLEEQGYLQLADSGFIPRNYNQGQNCYRVSNSASVKITPVQNLHHQNNNSASVKISQEWCKNYPDASVKITPKYKDKTKEETKDNNNPTVPLVSKPKKDSVSYSEFIELSNLSQEVKTALSDYFEHRQDLSKSNKAYKTTNISIKRIVNDVESDKYSDNEHRIKSINKAIESNWKSIYPVNTFSNNNEIDPSIGF